MDFRIDQLKRYLKNHFNDELSVKEMAVRVNLSPSHLSHLFKRELSVSPRKFLKQIRMSHARSLLERTFLSVKQIMDVCGYNDASHFVRDFEMLHGQTPRRYREHYFESRRSLRSGFGQQKAQTAKQSELPTRISRKDSVTLHGKRKRS
jgi:AraC-like DNA-binding protein